MQEEKSNKNNAIKIKNENPIIEKLATITKKTKKAKKKSLSKKIIRFVLFSFIALIMVTTAICFGLAISTTFRQFAISQVTRIANKFLIAEIQIKDIRFNRISGISIEEIKILTADDTLAAVERLNIDVNFESIFGEILIRSLEIENPRIKLLRSTADSIWNFNKIAAASNNVSPPDSTPSAFGMKINSLVIKNGYFIYWDSLNPTPTYKEFQEFHTSTNITSTNTAQQNITQQYAKMNFTKMIFSELNLELRNTKIKLGEMLFATSVADLSAIEVNSGMRVNKISVDAELSKKGILAKNAKMKLQDAEVKFDGSMTNFNVFGAAEEKNIANAEMFIDLNAKNFDPKFLDNFAFIPVRLGLVKNLNVFASGTLQDMSIQKVSVDTYQSHFELNNARTTNLLTPKKLTYEGTITSTFVRRDDFANILQNIDLKAVPNFLHTSINNTKFFGTLDSVYANFDLKTGIGNVDGKASISFGKNPMKYEVDLTTNSLNLATITDDNLITKLNSKIKITGSDFNPEKMKAAVDIDLLPSKINDIDLFDSKIAVNYLGQDSFIINDFSIDFADFHFANKDDKNHPIAWYDQITEHSKIRITGGGNLKNIDNPHFVVEAVLQNLNLNSLLKNENLPCLFSSKLKFDIQGYHLDNMRADATINIEDLTMRDKSMFPFEIRARVRTSERRRRNNPERVNPERATTLAKKSIRIDAKNDFEKMFNFDISGDISENALINGILQNFSNVAKFITSNLNNTISTINVAPYKKESTQSELKEKPIEDFPIANFDIKFEVKSVSFLDVFLDGFNSNNTDILGELTFHSTDKSSVLNIEQISINDLNFTYDKNIIDVRNLHLAGLAQVDIVASNPNLTKLGINIKHCEKINFIKDLSIFDIDTLLLSTAFENDKFYIDVSGSFNSLVTAKLKGGFEIDNENIQVYLDSLTCNYQNEFWRNSEQIKINLHTEGINFQQFDFFRENKEHLSISGKINDDNINNLKINIHNFEVYDLNNLLFLPLKMQHLPLTAKLDSLSILINGNYSQPIIKSDITARNLAYNKQFIGHLNSNINYQNDKLYGNVDIFARNQDKLFELAINSIPVYLGFDEGRQLIIENKPLDISVAMNQLPVQFLSQIVPSVDNIRGRVNGKLNISGFLPDKYNYEGNVELDNISFRLAPTNLEYTASGKVAVTTDYIAFNEIRVHNAPRDLQNGVASISGKVELKQFELQHIDISLTSRQFQLLGNQTEISMPWLFGRMVIRTDEQPLRFHGSLTEPNLTGSITILNADLNMPQILADEVVRRETRFTYINRNALKITETIAIDEENLDTVNQSNSQRTNSQGVNSQRANDEQTRDFADLLNIDISVRIRRFAITLELMQLRQLGGQIYAKIGTTNPQIPIRYVKDRTQAEAKIYNGELNVLEGSTVQIFRMISARGVINFPTARISRPDINLVATYRTKVNNQSGGIDIYVVDVKIEGTADRPEISLSYSVNGSPAIGEKNQIEVEAIQLLTTGTIGNRMDLVNEGKNFLLSQMASETLTELLMKTGVVQSANLRFEGDGFNSAEFNISGSIFGVAMWTIGGQVQDITSNYEVSIDFPITINKNALNNLILQGSKATNINNSTFDRNAKNWEIKLKLDGKW